VAVYSSERVRVVLIFFGLLVASISEANSFFRSWGMEHLQNSVWIRFWQWLDRYAIALEYDPVEDLHARISLLEEEVRALRRGRR
jgi:hypothetical protein